jgi:predicted molibdopterin-dependent oxidoreductase YjgC
LWGSNARETHPIFFHHVLKGVRRGARLFAIDPRHTASAAWADRHLALAVGSDVALANGVAHAILTAGLENHAFIARATTGFAAYRDHVLTHYPLDRVAALTGVAPADITAMAHAYARADRAMICWTLGITEHANAVDNVLALINLALLTGQVGRWGAGLNPLRGQNNVQGGGDMGALPHKLTGFQDVADPIARGRFERAWGVTIPPEPGWHLTDMFHAMDRRELRALYVIGENPARSEADGHRTVRLLEGLDHLVVQDLFLTPTAELADVVLPASASFAESDGTVTNSERRVQRVRRAVAPPAGARDDLEIIAALSKAPGPRPGRRHPGRAVGRAAGAVADARRHELRPTRRHRRDPVAVSRRGSSGLAVPPRPAVGRAPRGAAAPFSVVDHAEPVDPLDAEFPLRLTTGRRLDSFNTGVQSGSFASPLRRGESIDLAPDDAVRYGVTDGEVVRVSSRRGAVLAPVRVDPGLRPGLAFMTFHFPDEVDTNLLTIDAHDPRSGTAEFKAAAIRIDRRP